NSTRPVSVSPWPIRGPMGSWWNAEKTRVSPNDICRPRARLCEPNGPMCALLAHIAFIFVVPPALIYVLRNENKWIRRQHDTTIAPRLPEHLGRLARRLVLPGLARRRRHLYALSSRGLKGPAPVNPAARGRRARRSLCAKSQIPLATLLHMGHRYGWTWVERSGNE